jgi:hypothetical protein
MLDRRLLTTPLKGMASNTRSCVYVYLRMSISGPVVGGVVIEFKAGGLSCAY